MPVTVPGYWPLPARGSAVYRTHLEFSVKPDRWDALWFDEVPSSARFLVNGIEIGRSGQIGTDRSSESPHIAPVILRVPKSVRQETLILEIQVSNYHARAGGILGAAFGKHADFARSRAENIAAEYAAVGVILLIGTFSLGASVFQRSRALACFGIFSLLALGRVIGAQGLFEEIGFDGQFTDTRLMLEYLGGTGWSVPAFFGFLTGFFPLTIRGPSLIARILRSLGFWFVIPGGIGIGLVVLVIGDASLYGQAQPVMVYLYLVPAVIVNIAVLIRAVYLRASGAPIVLVGALVLGLCIVHDVVHQAGGEPGIWAASTGILALVLSLGTAVIADRRRLSEQIRLSEQNLARQNSELLDTQAQKDRFLLETSSGLQLPLETILKSTLELLTESSLRLTTDQRRQLTEVADHAALVLNDFRRVENCLAAAPAREEVRPLDVASIVRRELILQKELSSIAGTVEGPAEIFASIDAAAFRYLLAEILLLVKQAGASALSVKVTSGTSVKMRNAHGVSLQFRAPNENESEIRGTLGFALARSLAEKSGGSLRLTEDALEIVLEVILPTAVNDPRSQEHQSQWFANEAQSYFAPSQ